MELNYKLYFRILIRLSTSLSLIFFYCLILSSCEQSKKEAITILWKDSLAIGISIPKALMANGFAHDSLSEHLNIHLQNRGPESILGGYSQTEHELIFRPLIPFSRGSIYEISFRSRSLGRLTIPAADAANPPSLVAIYPAEDTLPENLLKIYLQFSHPMREGESQKHIALLNRMNDTISNVFLDLQPELWNEERTTLTIWLDPGRIKRDLIPNRRMGNPLKKGEQYTISVSRSWKDISGRSLPKSYTRQFIVGPRDSISPEPHRWIIQQPSAGSLRPLIIYTYESLDYFLLQETIHILNDKGEKLHGTFKVGKRSANLAFTPNHRWKPGRYILQVAAYLEDLAGNNLNRVFDRDIRLQKQKDKAVVETEFEITMHQ